MKWAYGVTTVPRRRDDLLPRTLQSLARGGFDHPRLFVDGCDDPRSWEREFDLPVTGRNPSMMAYGNWVLALAELFIREPAADRYALFQDDLLAYRNLRGYLERCVYPDRGYWNLYTFPPGDGKRTGPQLPPPPRLPGGKRGVWFESNQRGRGALGLVFDRKGVSTLLTYHPDFPQPGPSDFVVQRSLEPIPQKRGRNIDGAVVSALARAGWREWVHDPSLVQHTGLRSMIGTLSHPLAETFRGEDFDALQLLDPAEI